MSATPTERFRRVDSIFDAVIDLPSESQATYIDRACEELLRAVTEGQRIVVVGDYDADGATGVALAVSALRAMGAADVDYLVPSRFTQGYGLSPPLAPWPSDQHTA